MIDNDRVVKRNKVVKKYKPLQISQKLLVTVLYGSLHVIPKTNFE